jgi:hypothetical protein
LPFSILSISPTHHVFHAPFTTALSLLLIITRIAAFPAELFQPIVTLGLTDPAINGTDAAGAANWTVLESLLSLAAPRRESEWTQADWALQHSHPFASSSGTAADLYEQMPLLSVEVALDAVAFQVSFSSTVSAARVRVAPAIVFGDIPPHILVSTLIDVAAAHAGLGGRGRRLACSGW